MKTIYLVRHAKSSWRHREMRDFERPLKKRGLNDALTMSSHLQEKGEIPQHVISSPAMRALQTAKIFTDTLSYPTDQIEENRSIYGASRSEILAVVMSMDNSIDSAMVFGHEPTMSYFTEFLTGKYIEKFSTAAVAKIQFDINSWDRISEGTGKLLFFIYPRMFD